MRRIALACVVAAAALCPAGAFAHANVVRIDPPAQSVVARSPAQIVLHFDQQVTVVRGGVTVTGPSGASVIAAAPHLASDDVRALVIPLAPRLARGDYTIRWRTASADGHFVSGAFAIGVGAGLAAPQLATTVGSAVDSGFLVARFLYFIGLLVLVGGALARLVVFAPAARTLSAEHAAEVEGLERTSYAVLAFAGTALVVVGGWAAVVRQATQIAGVSFWSPLSGSGTAGVTIGSTRFGREFGYGLDAAAVFFALLLCAYALRRWRPLLYAIAGAAAIAGGWAIVGSSIAGHAGDPGKGWLALAVDALHLAGTAVWVGGLAHLFVVVAPATAILPAEERKRIRLEVAQRFSRLALASVVVIGASGIGRALWELSAVSQIWTTGYGRMLIIKTVLFCALIGLGYRNRTSLADFSALRRRVGLELALLVTLIAAVSLLTNLPPANTPTSVQRGAGVASGR